MPGEHYGLLPQILVIKGLKFILRPQNYRPIAIDSQNSNKLCVGTALGSVYCSNNAGNEWTDIDPNKQFFPDEKPIAAISFDGADQLIVASAKV